MGGADRLSRAPAGRGGLGGAEEAGLCAEGRAGAGGRAPGLDGSRGLGIGRRPLAGGRLKP